MAKNTVTVFDKALERALEQARGPYQRDLLRGERRWSGADLLGKARQYASHYSLSRANLLDRLERAGIPHHMQRGKHNRLCLILGVW